MSVSDAVVLAKLCTECKPARFQVAVQFVIHKAGILNRPVGNCRYASPYGYGFQ
jgi:hypothetical protein